MNSHLLSTTEIRAGFATVLASPTDRGRLEDIVVRPSSEQRERREQVLISPERGVEGDRWFTTSWKKLPDGSPDPQVQVSLMNARLLKLIAAEEERICLAGDNLIVDFDLSEANVPIGQKLRIGEAVIEVSDIPHTGCGKFTQRYGKDAVGFVNSPEGRKLRLRGIFAKVLKAGTVRVGDTVEKVK